MEKVYFVKYTERLRKYIEKRRSKRTLCYVLATIINLVALIGVLNSNNPVISREVAIICVICTSYPLWVLEDGNKIPEFKESSLVTVDVSKFNSKNFSVEFTGSGYMIFDLKEDFYDK